MSSIYAYTTNETNADLVISSENTNGNIILKPKTKIIDVRGDFVWSITPKKGVLQSIPAMYLVERTQRTNSLISSALYYITTFLSKSGLTGGTVLDQSNKNNIITNIINILNNTLGSGKKTTSDFNNTISSLTKKIEKIASNKEDKALLNTDYLKSYIGIYLTKATEFRYVLPYFNNSFIGLNNTWGAQAQQPTFIASTLVNQVMEGVDKAANVANILQPGTFIEKPKYFQYPTEGESITVSFPLLNTHNPHNNAIPYQQNYELLWILAYQNKPYRTSFSRIIPPKIYTLTIPGVKYMPYSYISNMSVDFQGTVRNLDVTLPSGDVVSAPIPDAYIVTITFTSLIADIGNMLVTKDFGKKIQTSTR